MIVRTNIGTDKKIIIGADVKNNDQIIGRITDYDNKSGMATIMIYDNNFKFGNEQLFISSKILLPSVVHCKKEPFDVYIGRPSKWGNPFTHIKDGKTLAKHIVADRESAIKAYEEWITNGDGKHLLNDLHELNGKILGCWCKPLACHGDVLRKLVIELTNQNKQITSK